MILFAETVDPLGFGVMAFLILALGAVFAFEFVNGFHDTANAVATVIYTKSLKPTTAVIWSGFCNFIGLVFSGAVGHLGVAFGIVYLLPVDLLMDPSSRLGYVMVVALLGSAMIWNVGTWYLGLPASSSHSMIGAILGVGLSYGLLMGNQFGEGVNWRKAGEVGLSLLFSPLIGFIGAGLLLLLAKRLIPNPDLYVPPAPDQPPPRWIRAILIFTCSGVSFAHGSNDGQKGVGLAMLILIGLLPFRFAVNPHFSEQESAETVVAATELARFISERAPEEASEATARAAVIQKLLGDDRSVRELTGQERSDLRFAVFQLERIGLKLRKLEIDERLQVERWRDQLRRVTEYAPVWILLGIAAALGVGTTVGWKRIVVTVGEKIGKAHLTYAQGAAAELVAMTTIMIADATKLPASTTHVLSSAIAGTMTANRSGVDAKVISKIAMAWIFTLPATILLAMMIMVIGVLFI